MSTWDDVFKEYPDLFDREYKEADQKEYAPPEYEPKTEYTPAPPSLTPSLPPWAPQYENPFQPTPFGLGENVTYSGNYIYNPSVPHPYEASVAPEGWSPDFSPRYSDDLRTWRQTAGPEEPYPPGFESGYRLPRDYGSNPELVLAGRSAPSSPYFMPTVPEPVAPKREWGIAPKSDWGKVRAPVPNWLQGWGDILGKPLLQAAEGEKKILGGIAENAQQGDLEGAAVGIATAPYQAIPEVVAPLASGYLNALGEPSKWVEQQVVGSYLDAANDYAKNPSAYTFLPTPSGPESEWVVSGKALPSEHENIIKALAALPEGERKIAIEQLKRMAYSPEANQLKALEESKTKGWEQSLADNSSAWHELIGQSLFDPMLLLPSEWAKVVYAPINKPAEMAFGALGKGAMALKDTPWAKKALEKLAELKDPYIRFSSVSNVANPLEHYLGIKVEMKELGAYNGIIPKGAKIDRVVDVFGGSGYLSNVFQKKLGVPRILNDANPNMANFHLMVQQKPDEVIAVVKYAANPFKDIINTYPTGGKLAGQEVRNSWKAILGKLEAGNDIERAANEFMKSGPFGKSSGDPGFISGAKGNYIWRDLSIFDDVDRILRAHHDALKDTTILNRKAEDLLPYLGHYDLALLDPPYVPKPGASKVMGYGPYGENLTKVSGALEFINQHIAQADLRGVPMIVTNNVNDKVIDALKNLGFNMKLVELRGGQYAKPRTEVVGWNDNIGSLAPGRRGRYSSGGIREPESAGLDNLFDREKSGQISSPHGAFEKIPDVRRGGGIETAPRVPGELLATLDFLARHPDSIRALFANPRPANENNPNAVGARFLPTAPQFTSERPWQPAYQQPRFPRFPYVP